MLVPVYIAVVKDVSRWQWAPAVSLHTHTLIRFALLVKSALHSNSQSNVNIMQVRKGKSLGPAVKPVAKQPIQNQEEEVVGSEADLVVGWLCLLECGQGKKRNPAVHSIWSLARVPPRRPLGLSLNHPQHNTHTLTTNTVAKYPWLSSRTS